MKSCDLSNTKRNKTVEIRLIYFFVLFGTDPVEGGKLTLQHYFDAGKQACRTINADLPLLCLDLTYMGALLHNGYGLPKTTPILALKKIRGHEISWALGAAYHILQNGV